MAEPTPTDELAWHYTDAAALHRIITSHSLRATSAAFMNDAEEMKSGRVALASLYESRLEALDDSSRRQFERSGILGEGGRFSNFLLSASRDGDSLTLWRNYGGDQVAYSVGLDRDAILVPLSQSEREDHPFPPPGYYEPEWEEHEDGRTNLNASPDYALVLGGGWHKVTYITGPDDPKVQEQFDALIESSKRERFVFSFSFTNSPTDFMKHIGFEDEREVRSVTWVNPLGSSFNTVPAVSDWFPSSS